MAQVSKHWIPKEIQERILSVFVKTLANLKTESQTRLFLDDLLTSTEKVMLAKRVAIAFLLSKDYSYRKISLMLNVSMSTIGWVSDKYKHASKFKNIVDRVVKNEEIAQLWDHLGEKFASAMAVGKGRPFWGAIRNELQKKQKKRVF